jgi:hypothetical protein
MGGSNVRAAQINRNVGRFAVRHQISISRL